MNWDSPYTKKHIAEAEAQGCVLLGPGRSFHYRTYRLPCGHERGVQIIHMRTGNFRCQTCMDAKLTGEAEAQGCTLLGVGRSCHYRTYRLPCGHEQETQTNDMRIGSFRCQTCLENRLIEEAEAQGCVLLGVGRNTNSRTYRLACGHEQELKVGHVKSGRFRCQTCLDDRLNAEAEDQGCTLLGAGRNSNYRTYRLACGHELEVQATHMRSGVFLCQTCEETTRTQPSNIYLLHIQVADTEWLKLGYAKNIEHRASKYGLPAGAAINLLASLPMDTGREAYALEAHLHKVYRPHRIPRRRMKKLHTRNGYTECYPMRLLPDLLMEMGAPK